MKKFIVLAVVSLFLSLSAFAGDEVRLDCKTDVTIGEENFKGQYKIVKRGESLFSSYRHNPAEPWIETDDVVMKNYIGRRLEDYAKDGPLVLIAHTAGLEVKRIKKVVFYGIDAKRDDTPANDLDDDPRLEQEEDYESVLWDLYDKANNRLSTVALPGWELTKCLD